MSELKGVFVSDKGRKVPLCVLGEKISHFNSPYKYEIRVESLRNVLERDHSFVLPLEFTQGE